MRSMCKKINFITAFLLAAYFVSFAYDACLFNALLSAVCLYNACFLLLILPIKFALLLFNNVFCLHYLSLGY